MNKYLGLIMACVLLSACQAQREKFISLWSPSEVADDASAHPTDYASLIDNPLGQPHTPAQADAPNKLLTMTDMSGNREYLFTDSISQERGILTALIEFRYVRPQTLPANGMTYHYNQWREQIDCKNKVRILRTTTHYNLAGEIVDTINYPLPKYKPAELAALAQPNDKAIQYICERAGETGLAVGDAAVATTAKDDGKTKPEKNSKNKKDKTDKNNNKVENKEEKENKVEKSESSDKSQNNQTKNSKNKKEKEDKIKVEEKIDFINKDKDKTEAAEKTASDKPDATTEAPSETKTDKKKKSKKTKADKKTNPEPSTPAKKTIEPEVIDDVDLLEEGEMPLKPLK